MRPEALTLGERLRRRRVAEQTSGRIAYDRRAFDEIVDRKRAGEEGGAARRQRVIRAGHIVAKRLGAPGPHEDRTRVTDTTQKPESILAVKLKVLRRHRVHRVDRRGYVRGDDDGPLVVERSARDLLARALRHEELDGALDLCRKSGVAGDEIAGGKRIVLCLSHEIGCDHGRLGGGIGEHADLGWTGDHIDSHIARDELLSRGHVGVTGTSDDIDLFDALGAVGERGDGLGASHGIDLVHACDARCSERLGRDATGLAHLRVVLRGRHHHDALHAGDLGRNDVHEHRGGVLRATARHVDTGSSHGRHLDAEHRAVGARREPRLLDLALVKRADLRRRLLERSAEAWTHELERALQRLLGQAQPLELDAIELFRITAQGIVAALTHILHDGARRGNDGVGQHALANELPRAKALAGCQGDSLHATSNQRKRRPPPRAP